MALGDMPPTYHAVIKRDLETGAKDRRWRKAGGGLGGREGRQGSSRSKDDRRLSY